MFEGIFFSTQTISKKGRRADPAAFFADDKDIILQKTEARIAAR